MLRIWLTSISAYSLKPTIFIAENRDVDNGGFLICSLVPDYIFPLPSAVIYIGHPDNRFTLIIQHNNAFPLTDFSYCPDAYIPALLQRPLHKAIMRCHVSAGK